MKTALLPSWDQCEGGPQVLLHTDATYGGNAGLVQNQTTCAVIWTMLETGATPSLRVQQVYQHDTEDVMFGTRTWKSSSHDYIQNIVTMQV